MGSVGPAPLATLNSGGLAVPHGVVVRSKRDAWLMRSLKSHPERQAYDRDSGACLPGEQRKVTGWQQGTYSQEAPSEEVATDQAPQDGRKIWRKNTPGIREPLQRP